MPRSLFAPMTDAVRPRLVRGRSGLIALLAVLLAGCSDRVAGPSASLPLHGITVGRGPAGVPHPDVIIHNMSDDSTSADFTVTPTGGVFAIGPHAIYLPANSICDPVKSTYGPTEWDKPCEVLTEPIRFHAEVRNENGRQWVDFTPAVRFRPTDELANAVWLYMKTSALSLDSDSAMAALRRMSILYSPEIGVAGINEALIDPSLRTYVWLDGGVAFRRIKHFSGYNVHDGFKCSQRDSERFDEHERSCDADEDVLGLEEGEDGLLDIGRLIVPVM
jgi:hypothetical protein